MGVSSASFSFDGKQFSFEKELNKKQKCSARIGAPSLNPHAGMLDGRRGLFLLRFLKASKLSLQVMYPKEKIFFRHFDLRFVR